VAAWHIVVASLFLMIPMIWFIIYLVLRKFNVKGRNCIRITHKTVLVSMVFLLTSSPSFFLFMIQDVFYFVEYTTFYGESSLLKVRTYLRFS